jgi:hypothetical protein
MSPPYLLWLIYFKGRDYVSELLPLTDILFVPQMIGLYEYGERRWNDIDRRKPKNSEKNLSQCQFVHHKSHMDWPGSEPGLRVERPLTNRLSHGTAYNTYLRHVGTFKLRLSDSSLLVCTVYNDKNNLGDWVLSNQTFMFRVTVWRWTLLCYGNGFI